MKGLLIKDLRLMKVQKNFFIIFIVIAVGMAHFPMIYLLCWDFCRLFYRFLP